MSEVPQNSICVSGLSPSTPEKKVADFFSFCGKINNLDFRKTNSSCEAVITFDSGSASSTALLLSGSNIDGNTIAVAPHTVDTLEQHLAEEVRAAPGGAPSPDANVSTPGTAMTEEEIIAQEMASLNVSSMPQEQIPVRTQQPTSAASVIASIIASGYTLGAGTVAAAKAFDEEKGITSTVNESVTTGTGAIKERTKQLDEQYHISEQASQLGERVSTSLQEFEEQYHVMEATNAGLAVAAAKVNEWGDVVSQGIQSAIEAPSVQSTWASLKTWGSSIANSVATAVEPATSAVSKEFTEIKTATEAKIDEKMVEKGFEAPSAARATKKDQEMVNMAASQTAANADATANDAVVDFVSTSPTEHELFDSDEKVEAKESADVVDETVDAEEEAAQMHELEDEVFSDPIV